MLHTYPLNDEREHDTGHSTTCWCGPRLEMVNGEMWLIHNSADGREVIEEAEAIKAKVEDHLE